MEQFQIEPRRPTPDPDFPKYKYRFLIVILYGFYSGANLYQLNQFTIIENVIAPHYKTSSYAVNISQLIFMVDLIIFIVPVVRIIEQYDLKVASVLCSSLTFLGAVMKVFFTAPSPDDFYFILVAQFICGIGQVFTIMLPAKVVAVWFPSEEQNRACAAALFGGELGMLLGAVCPILYVHEKNTNAEITSGLRQMLQSNAVICALAFLAVLVLFKPKPPAPPSAIQSLVQDHKTHYYTAFFELSANKDFLYLVLLFGISCGMWSVFGIFENLIYLHYFPKSLMDLTTITAITSISGGMIGNYLFGYILDKTLKYKLFTFLNFVCITLSYCAMVVFLEMRWHWSSYITVILFGFFSSCSVNISFQYIAEVTYPISSVVPIACLQVIICAVTVISQVIFSLLLAEGYIMIVHWLTMATFCIITFGTYFLSSNLKRMRGRQEIRELRERRERRERRD